MSGWPTVKPRYQPFTLVYLRANPDLCGSVTGFITRAGCAIQYMVTWGDEASEQWHWEGELTDQRQYRAGGDET